MNGVFAVNKPSGPTSRDVVNKLKHILSESPTFTQSIRERLIAAGGNKKLKKRLQYIKIGHGGTLDPLADGVLVIGIGTGTKMLQKYLGDCTKTYRATAVFGVETTTFDAEGKVVKRGSVSQLDREKIETALTNFRGDIEQMPPMYSALKMNGKPLYQYARANEALPKEIQPRKCHISRIEMVGDIRFEHEFEIPADEEKVEAEVGSEVTEVTKNTEVTLEKDGNEEKEVVVEEKTLVETVAVESEEPASTTETTSGPHDTAAVDIVFSVSSGTYIRSLIHDIGHALGTCAYMAKLTRLSQGDWDLESNVLDLAEFTDKTPEEFEAKLLEVMRVPATR